MQDGNPTVLGRSLPDGRHLDVQKTIEVSVQITPVPISGP
jgi:hypothetical protein